MSTVNYEGKVALNWGFITGEATATPPKKMSKVVIAAKDRADRLES